jgi:hypothetical protein
LDYDIVKEERLHSMKRKLSKTIITIFTLLLTLVIGEIAIAATHGNYSNGVRSTEHYQLYYHGEAWTTRNGNTTWIRYYRNNTYLGGAVAMKDSWRPASDRVYEAVTVWDSMNPWAAKTIYRYKL